MKEDKGNKLSQRLWWMDREDPRFGSTALAKLGFLIVWTLGFLLLLLVAQLALSLLGRFGCSSGAGP